MGGMRLRRKEDRAGMDFRALRNGGPGDNITWKWLAGIAVAVLIIAGGAWMKTQDTRLDGLLVALDSTKGKVADQAVDQATTKQKVETIDKKLDEVRKDVSDIRGDLKQLLQQQQQILNQQDRQRR